VLLTDSSLDQHYVSPRRCGNFSDRAVTRVV